MKKLSLTLAGVALAGVLAVPLHAQSIPGGVDTSESGDIGGCVDSPENPTAILGLTGGAGAFAAYLKNRFRQRGNRFRQRAH